MASDPLIENLLILQERDVRQDDIQHRLDDIPLQNAALEREIAAAKAVLQKKLDEHKALETRKRDLENQTSTAEDQRVKFRTQQASVKKNDEYAALEKQIAATGGLIDKLETETMEIMVKLDEFAADVVDKQKKETAAELAAIQGKIESLARVKQTLEADLAEATTNTKAAREKVPTDALATYAYVKTRVKFPPYIVLLNEMRCQGCHRKSPTTFRLRHG